MMDIASDGLGFMNVLGNMGWVPLLYTLQGRYLLDHPQNWSYWALGGFFVLYRKLSATCCCSVLTSQIFIQLSIV